MAAPHVYIVVDATQKGASGVIRAYTTATAAQKVAKSLHGEFIVKRVALLEGEDAAQEQVSEIKAGKTTYATAAEPKQEADEDQRLAEADDDGDGGAHDKDEAVDGQDEEDEDVEPAPSKKKTATSTAKSKASSAATTKSAAGDAARKTIPDGKPDALRGLKLLFTGTFDSMDRKTCEATAKVYGAQVITKLEDTDYIVLGTRAGTKKLETIAELGLETISEQEFFDMLRDGVPAGKRKRIADRTSTGDGPAKKRAKR